MIQVCVTLACKNMAKLGEILKLDLSKNVLEHASTYIFSNLKGSTVTVDSDRNIYVSKGKAAFPAFVASFNKDTQDEDTIVERINKNVWVGYEKLTERVLPSEFAAGTKAGIYLALKLIEKLDDVKCVFKFNNTLTKLFFEDCRWVIELNGKGNTEILTTSLGIPQCSSAFNTIIKTVGKKYGYEIGGSGVPPISVLDLPISMVNIPNGHYAPYSGFHQIVEGDVTKALNFCQDMAKMVPTVCKIDDGCGSCGARLTRHEEYFCYKCVNKLRDKHLKCKKCSGNLYTAKEFYTVLCYKCK